MSLRIKLATDLAIVALILATAAAAIGLLVAGVYRDQAEMVRQARAADLVTLMFVAPLLGCGLWRARSGSSNGRVVAVGVLGYLAYSYAIYAFSVEVNPLTVVHIAILGLATWSVALFGFGLDWAALARESGTRLPRRTTATFLTVVAALFAFLWLGQIAGAVTSGSLPASIGDLNLPTTPIYALDLAFALPILTIVGTWLARRDRRAPASAMAALSFVAPMGLSVIAIFAVDASAGIAVEVVPVAIFGIVTIASAALMLQGLRPKRIASARVLRSALAGGTTP
jgi:hypothetical protein